MAFGSLNKLPLNVSYHKPKKLKGSSSPECSPSGVRIINPGDWTVGMIALKW